LRHVDEYRDSRAVDGLLHRIAETTKEGKPLAFMEVCGTHTMVRARYGLGKLLPRNMRLISGPGCPVCVTPNSYIDRAVAISREDDCTLLTFGDMFRVPGSTSSLKAEKSKGADVRVVYSPAESLDTAQKNPARKIVFLGIGFETTAPAVASTILAAEKLGLSNWFVLSGHKTVPEVMGMLAGSHEVRIDGFVCPGHVSAVIGSRVYERIARDFRVPCVVAGFEPTDILQAIWMLARQKCEGRSVVENQYSRVVEEGGNERAVSTMMEVFELVDSVWRGMGRVPGSGLSIRERFAQFDAEKRIEVEVEETVENPACICGEILRGVRIPPDCTLFGRGCTPGYPQGPCMVSSEGTCAAYYKYDRHEKRKLQK
jgi:hydrogenase expression/formation protein HypD